MTIIFVADKTDKISVIENVISFKHEDGVYRVGIKDKKEMRPFKRKDWRIETIVGIE